MTTTEASTTATFPLVWANPEDAELTWFFDIEHTPDVVTPLGYELYFGPLLNGFGWLRATLQNYYVYDWWQEGSFEASAVGMDTPKLIEMSRHFWDRIVPEVEAQTAYYLSTDFDAFSDDDLAAGIDKLPAWRTRMGQLHTRALFPYGTGMRRLITAYQELVADDELAAVRLVQGHGCRSVDAGRALWQLSQLAASIAPVRERISRVDAQNARDCMAALAREPAARPFLEAFSAFLNDFGWRTDLFELAMPTWAEDPSIPLCQMRGLLEMPDPDIELQHQVTERERWIAETMSRLSPEAAAKLQDAIDGARPVVSLQEDHNFYIDQRAAFSPRRLVLAAARRLVSNRALAEPNDVFYLRAADLLSALAGTTRAAQSIADRTKSEMQRWSQTEPPKTIGAPPPPTEDAPAPLGGLKDHDAKELSGNGASAGVARGPARVLMSLAEAGRLRPGDVLVARTTMPAWTPLFATACAVVTETGGVLSHAAVVAREYGIPAVLNVTEATRKIRDGQLVEVDGSRGIIRIIS